MHCWEISDNSNKAEWFFKFPFYNTTTFNKIMVHVLRLFTSTQVHCLHLSYAASHCLGFWLFAYMYDTLLYAFSTSELVN